MTDTPQVLLAHHLKTLKLPTVLREYDKLARHCATEGADHVRYLVRLTELELIDRERRMVERRIRQARFPAVKSLDSFDFKAIASLNKMLVLELARCEYVERRENIIALGNCLDRAWQSVRARAGLEDVRLHDLRHTFASQAAMQGIPLPVVARLLGHAQVQMTLRYAHVSDRDVEAAAERIGGVMAGIMNRSHVRLACLPSPR